MDRLSSIEPCSDCTKETVSEKWQPSWWAPAALAAFVGISRTQDYWHHWEDVCVGAVIGLCTAAMVGGAVQVEST
jgi:membrane-associated phospholipid phosphatase